MQKNLMSHLPYRLLACRFLLALLLVGAIGVYLQGICKKRGEYLALKKEAAFLQSQLVGAKEDKEDFLLQIESQSDPAWIEILLKRNLGLVSSGQTKIYFDSQ